MMQGRAAPVPMAAMNRVAPHAAAARHVVGGALQDAKFNAPVAPSVHPPVNQPVNPLPQLKMPDKNLTRKARDEFIAGEMPNKKQKTMAKAVSWRNWGEVGGGRDLILLKQVLAENPYDAVRGGKAKAWKKVAKALKHTPVAKDPEGKSWGIMSERKVRDRVAVVLDAYDSFCEASERKTGSSEEEEEWHQLAEELKGLRGAAESADNEKREARDKKAAKKKVLDEDGVRLRRAAMSRCVRVCVCVWVKDGLEIVGVRASRAMPV